MLPRNNLESVSSPARQTSPAIVRTLRRKRQRTRGVAMVEYAMIMPVFLLLFAGIIEFGRAVMVQQVITNAAREGARMAVRPGEDRTTVVSAVNNYLSGARVSASSNVVELEWSPDIAVSSPSWSTVSTLSSVPSQSAIRMSVSAQSNDVGWGVGWFLRDRTFQAQVIMRKE